MMQSTIRQSAIKFSLVAVKRPAYRALSATSVSQRGGLSAARRDLSSLSWGPTARAIRGTQTGRPQVQSTPQLQKQIRWNSEWNTDEPETPPLRQWTFEEVCHTFNEPTNIQIQIEESNNLRSMPPSLQQHRTLQPTVQSSSSTSANQSS